jgi:hypothetical protein
MPRSPIEAGGARASLTCLHPDVGVDARKLKAHTNRLLEACKACRSSTGLCETDKDIRFRSSDDIAPAPHEMLDKGLVLRSAVSPAAFEGLPLPHNLGCKLTMCSPLDPAALGSFAQ